MERKGFTMKMALDTTAVPSGGLRAKTGLRHKPHSFFVYVKHHPMLYLMLIPGLFFLFIYKLAPLYGILIAFKDYNIFLGSNPIDAIGLSDWVGLEHPLAVSHPYHLRDTSQRDPPRYLPQICPDRYLYALFLFMGRHLRYFLFAVWFLRHHQYRYHRDGRHAHRILYR